MNLNSILKEAIAIGANRVVRKPLASVRHDVAELKRQLAVVRRIVRELQRVAGRQPASLAEAEGSLELKRKRRPTGAGIRQMRKKLGLTQAQFAKLLGVSSLSVSKWERTKGPVSVRVRTMVALRKARGIGQRGALKALDA